MSELDRILSNLPVPRNPIQGRVVKRAARELAREANLAEVKVEGIARVAAHTAERLVDLDNGRNLTATNDVLNQLLVQVEINFVNKARQVQNEMYKDLGQS